MAITGYDEKQNKSSAFYELAPDNCVFTTGHNWCHNYNARIKTIVLNKKVISAAN